MNVYRQKLLITAIVFNLARPAEWTVPSETKQPIQAIQSVAKIARLRNEVPACRDELRKKNAYLRS
jgi:hypothetical protein